MLEYVTTHGASFLARWKLNGATRDNTDHGRAYVRVTRDGNTFTVTLCRDEARIQAVAEGTGENGELTLSPVDDSGLSGSVVLTNAATADAIIDIFYATDADLLARQAAIASLLKEGKFAGQDGFSEPCARAKRIMDALLNARLGSAWIADDLQPLADATALYALHLIYDHLSTRHDDPAAQQSRHYRQHARKALGQITLSIGGDEQQVFEPRLIRA